MQGALTARAHGKLLSSRLGVSSRPVLPAQQLKTGRSRSLRPNTLSRRTHVSVQASNRKELLESRLYRRTVADPNWWEDYLTTDRYFKYLLNMFDSRIIRAIYGPLGIVATTGVAVCTWETLRAQGILPEGLPSVTMPNQAPLGLTSFALSLLLVFRTNQSYDRWWEARKIWGAVLNRTRDIVTQANVFIPESEMRLREGIRDWTIAFTRALEAHLQGRLVQRPIKDNLEKVLNAEEMEMLMSSAHKPVKTLAVVAEIANQASINSIERQMLMQNVQAFHDYLGMCERIMRTPLPLTNTRHTSRFLFFWVNALPFAMYPSFGWGCIPISLVISTLLLGIDEIGVQIEEPFGVLPLDAICTTAENNMRQITSGQPSLTTYVESIKSGKSPIAQRLPSMDAVPEPVTTK